MSGFKNTTFFQSEKITQTVIHNEGVPFYNHHPQYNNKHHNTHPPQNHHHHKQDHQHQPHTQNYKQPNHYTNKNHVDQNHIKMNNNQHHHKEHDFKEKSKGNDTEKDKNKVGEKVGGKFSNQNNKTVINDKNNIKVNITNDSNHGNNITFNLPSNAYGWDIIIKN